MPRNLEEDICTTIKSSILLHTHSLLFRSQKDKMFTSRNGDRSDAPNIAIVITDGNSNKDKEYTIPFAIDARVKGVHIIVLSIGDMLNMLELNGMASLPSSANLHQARSWKDLSGLKDVLVANTCDGK